MKRSLLITAAVVLSVGPLAAAETPRDYTALVIRFARTFMDKGTDRYGPVHSPLWAAALDLNTLSLPTDSPKIPAGPRIREGDRCWKGCNPYLDAEAIRAFYELSRRTGDPQYRQAAERYLAYFLERCQSPTTGLLAWGEHTFWNLAFDAVDRDIHEFLVWLPLWPEMWELDAPAVRRAIEGIYAHH
ncbi:MAG: hypothetical protein FJ279_35385, partial [Planctomycetes bacterium]|nr:hypothetical protein [Planctomycetota bacterium]